MAMKITAAAVMVEGTYNNQLKVSVEEMAAAAATMATATATKGAMMTAMR